MTQVAVQAGPVTTVTIDNPARLNSLNSALIAELRDAFALLATDPELRAVVLTGRGEKAFVGGADIKEMAALDGPPAARAFITGLHRLCDAVRSLPVPVIARINGLCLGAGLELAASCDLRLAADHARFGMPEVKLGIPSVIEAALLPMLIGWGRTRELLLLGETMDAAEAAACGLIERQVPADGLDGAVSAWTDALLSAEPNAVRAQKRLIRSWEDAPLGKAIAAGIDAFADAYATPVPRAAMAAFLSANARRKAEPLRQNGNS